ncbi:conjugal transfer protein TraG N-terminal domain-containing protein, partial [Thiohalocapsa sp.]|uniref:conjugal transfer protein TraG N-terminal domain-containing protein n=1 Tax=Thiohalocapsa sp. TaxID=2497641 RepID=UPI0025FA7BFC
MFEIYSIGDGFYLTRVLNAVAALSGTDDMRLLASVGFLVGVIVTMLQSAFQARAPQMQTFFVSLVIYLAMFGASARVTVEDVFSGDTWVVDNVPIGVAAVGSGVSQLGYGVTRLFETAFATPSITDGYVRPLTLLQDVRKHTQSLVALGTANYPDGNQNTDLTRSMVNYINDCPLYEIDRGTRSWNEFMHARGWANTYASTQQAITTRLYLNGGVQDLTCRDAWTMLQDYIAVNLVPALEDSLAAATANDAATFPAELQTVLDNVAGAGIDARNYMVQSAFLPLMIQANANASAELQDWGQAAMIEQAGQQRNTQWAAEEVLFSRYVHPVMTFFEAFMFAAAPLMVFAIGLGPMGLKIVSRYLVFGLWIQLWMPVLAITNLYTVTGAERHVDALRDAAISNAHPDSIAGIFAMDRVIGDFLGTAGMLAASTPFITLMLIYGSAYTATALAGRLQGGDHIDEKIVSPSLATVGPLMQQSPGYANEPVGGTRAYGGEKVLPRFETQRSEDSLVKSFEAESRQAQTRFGQSLSSVGQESSQALRR